MHRRNYFHFALLAYAANGAHAHLEPQGDESFSDAETRNFAISGEKSFKQTTTSAAGAFYDWSRQSPGATSPGAALRTRFENGSRQRFHVGVKQKLTGTVTVALTRLRNESTEHGAPALGSGSTWRRRKMSGDLPT